jgi:periplasmic divalent cation tolerance protein
MNTPDNYCMVIATCAGREEADKLAEVILKHRLAACVQLMPITSHYEWKQEIHEDEELMLFMKTKTVLYDNLEALIVKHHSYEVPEIVRLPIQGGLKAYLGWIDEVTE